MKETVFPMFRATDPDTSELAAKAHEHKLSPRREQVMRMVLQYPGATAGELSRYMHQHFPELPISSAVETPHKRLPELEKLGYVVRGQERPCGDSNYVRTTWWVKQ